MEKVSLISKGEREKRKRKLAAGKAICELDNRVGYSEYAKSQNKRYVSGEIDENALIKNILDHYMEK